MGNLSPTLTCTAPSAVRCKCRSGDAHLHYTERTICYELLKQFKIRCKRRDPRWWGRVKNLFQIYNRIEVIVTK